MATAGDTHFGIDPSLWTRVVQEIGNVLDALNAAATPLPDTGSDPLRKAVDNLMRALGRVLIEVERPCLAAERSNNPPANTRRSNDRELLEQAHKHRMKAEEYRVVAQQVRDPIARATYLRLADAYETLAKRRESDAKHVNPSLRIVHR